MSRPPGEVRQALRVAAVALGELGGGFTWREAAEAACVGFAVARQTVRNMEVAGELACVGQTRQGRGRPLNVYVAQRRDSWVARGSSGVADELGRVLNRWGR